MIRFICERTTWEGPNQVVWKNIITIDAKVDELEAVLKRGGVGYNAGEVTHLIGFEILNQEQKEKIKQELPF